MQKIKIIGLGTTLLMAACANHTVQQKGNTMEKVSMYNAAGREVMVYTTADSGSMRLKKLSSTSFYPKSQPVETEIFLTADPATHFQSFHGIGGALTDASAETFYKLPQASQDELMQAYFSKTNGIGYTVGRTNINSCDFSSDTYDYVKPNDASLASFDIAHDRKFKIPFIKKAMEASGNTLNLFASPWSPPSWMKTNNDMLHGGKLLPAFYQSWANYYTKFIKAYQQEGIPVWGISIQNEPMATQRWESCIYTAEEETNFLKNYLGPTMKREGLGDKKIIVWDHNRDLIFQRAQTYFNDPEAAKYIWGIGFHWYEDWSGGTQMFDNLGRVHEAFPQTNLFFTEGCAESFDPTRYNAWALGERYGKSMINDFNNGMTGFTDWNILLDDKGGPNHVGNFCFAPVHADSKTGKLIYTNAYYYIGHFSKFIQPGARRIPVTASRSQLLTTGFINPDGKTVIIVMNQSAKHTPYMIWINGQAADLQIPPHAISTLIF